MKLKTEWKIIILVLLSTFLFAWGGTSLKAARRFILPCLLALGASNLGVRFWKCLAMLPLAIVALCLPYGENSSIFIRIATSLSFGICLLPLTHKKNWFLTLIVPAIFGLNYWLSLNIDFWTWKLAELATGFAFGFAVVLVALSRESK